MHKAFGIRNRVITGDQEIGSSRTRIVGNHRQDATFFCVVLVGGFKKSQQGGREKCVPTWAVDVDRNRLTAVRGEEDYLFS